MLFQMQLRFDGVFGFPGGLVEAGEDPMVGMNREMEEEIGLDLEKHRFLDSNHIASFVNLEKSLVLHFFLKEVTLEEFCVLEKNNLQAPEYGTEVMKLQLCHVLFPNVELLYIIKEWQVSGS